LKAAPDPVVDDDVTEDGFLGGRIVLRQPRRGHRSGIEAVLIAACAPLEAGQSVIDIGSGVGAAGLCALSRVPGASGILVEADHVLVDIARSNVVRNGLDDRCRVVGCDILRVGSANRAGLSGLADHALANPPFHDPGRVRISPHKAGAHVAPAAALDAWPRFAAAALRPGGTFTMVHRAEALADVLAVFAGRFGALRVLPLHPRPDAPAIRVIVQAVKGSRAPLTVLPGLALHGADGDGFAPRVEAVLRDGAPLGLAPDSTGPHL
jgi:tRNA1(Val) A37 N6-methylase TrmN6